MHVGTSDSRYDCDGFLHATWCAASKAGSIDDADLCDCNPCNCCEGAGHVINEEGKEETCGQCGGNPHRRPRMHTGKAGTR